MFLALKEMKKEKARFLMIILVTMLIAYLIYFLSALAFGLAQANRTAVDQWRAEGVIVSKAANQSIYASIFDKTIADELAMGDGESLTIANTVVYLNGDESRENQFNLVFIGTESSDSALIAPVVEGRSIADDHEIVVSEGLKKLIGIQLNDTVKLATTGRIFTVVGFTESASYNTQPVAYAQLMMASQAMMSYSTGDESTDASAVATPNMPERISALVTYESVDQDALDDYDLEYVPMDQFIESIPGYQAQVLTFGMMIIFLVVIASIIIGIFMYILTMQKRSIFGVLKIQGINNAYITQSIIVQTVILIIVGLLVGFVLTLLTFMVIPDTVPIEISWELYAIVSGLSLICALIGTVFSARNILKIDPLDAL